jgi:hypothetical protein
MLQTVIIPGQTNVNFQIPVDYIGKRVEITCYPVDDKKPRKTFGEYFGLMPAEDAQKLREHTERARKEWDRLT